LATVGRPDNAAGRPVLRPGAGPGPPVAGWFRVQWPADPGPGGQPVPPAGRHQVRCGRPASRRLRPLRQRRYFC